MLNVNRKINLMSKSAALLTTLLLFDFSHAVPTLYPAHWDSGVKNNTSSALVHDSESGRRMYVLPPATATAEVKSLSQATTNLGFCKELSAIQKYNLDALEIIKRLQDRRLQLENEYKQNEAHLKSAQIEMVQFVTANNLLELDALDRQIASLDKKLNELYVHSKTCTKTCDLVISDIRESQKNRSHLLGLRFDLSSAQLAQAGEYEKRKTRIANIEADRDRSHEILRRLQNEIREMYADYLALYDAHAKREGAKVVIDYKSFWSQNVNRLSFDNPNKSFEKIPTKNAIIKADAYGKNNLLPGSSIVSFEVAGQSADSKLMLASFPESFSANATLNLLSACPVFYPQLFGFSPDHPAVQPQNMKFGLLIGYEYPSEFKYKLEVEYNLSRMYEIIKTQGKKGGFFSSKSWSDLQERELLQDAFTVRWLSQDVGLNLSPAQKLEIESDLRKQAMSRLANSVILNKGGLPKTESPSALPQTGAVTLSNSLSKNCSLVLACKSASIGLDFLNAIFGSSEITESLRQQLDVTTKETYSTQQVLMQPGITGLQ